MIQIWRILCLIPLVLGWNAGASAAPFCLAGTGMASQCLYDDVANCLKAAEPPNTVCVIDPTTYLTYFGGSRYCEVGSDRAAQCIFADRNQCNTTAMGDRAVCIDRATMSDTNNPYRFESRIQN